MSVQVLVATMNQKDHSLLKKMNINSDVIVGNQCDINKVEKFPFKDYKAIYLNFNERGVGLNRNNALMRATGDICVFADDDIVYVDNYVEIIERSFMEHPKADILIFNLLEQDSKRKQIRIPHRVNRLNYLRYGTARIAFRLKSVKNNGIYFNQCFGGGTEHCHGEDTLFLSTCFEKGLNIVAVPTVVARLNDSRVSTWNRGYDDKYLVDQGILFKTISRKFWKVLCLQDSVRRHKKDYKTSWHHAYMLMTRGNNED